MFRIILPSFILSLALGISAAQGAGPSPSPAAASPKGSPTPTATASVEPAIAREELVNSLSSADVQAAISFVRTHFTNPEAVGQIQLDRAILQGLLVRLNNGLILSPANQGPEAATPFYSELLETRAGYLRIGTISAANLQAMDKKLAEFESKKADALIIDLRASGSGDFVAAAEFAKRFVPKGTLLFTLRKQGKPERVFTSDREPTYRGLLVALVDGDTMGSAEALAAALRSHDKALLIGQPTAGGAVEYADMALPGGKVLRVAQSDCVGPDGQSLYPRGIKPDLPVEMSLVDKREVFQLSQTRGMTPFTKEFERPHLNEAALIAGTNPELETSEQRRSRSKANSLHDPVLQRALDVITSLEVYSKR